MLNCATTVLTDHFQGIYTPGIYFLRFTSTLWVTPQQADIRREHVSVACYTLREKTGRVISVMWSNYKRLGHNSTPTTISLAWKFFTPSAIITRGANTGCIFTITCQTNYKLIEEKKKKKTALHFQRRICKVWESLTLGRISDSGVMTQISWMHAAFRAEPRCSLQSHK